MNIFVLDENPYAAARMHCDKHVVKMILESAQMLSTAHRVLDGSRIKAPSKSGKTLVKRWTLDNEKEDILYSATHINHPCNQWVRESYVNYVWLYSMFKALSEEFEFRYKKKHATWVKLKDALYNPPKNIPMQASTPYKLAMPDRCKITDDAVQCYRYYYIAEKFKIAKWEKGREVPEWYQGW